MTPEVQVRSIPVAHARVLRGAVGAVRLVTLALATLTGCVETGEGTESLRGIRRGRIYLHAETQAQITIDIEPTDGPDDYAYLEGPDGRTLERRLLHRRARQTLTRTLTEGAGTYTIVPSPSHRMRVVAHDARLSFEPEREFPSVHMSGEQTFVFDVAEGTESFTLAVTNQHDWEGTEATIALRRPDGWQAHRFELEPLDKEGILRRLGISEAEQRAYERQGDTAIVPEFRILIERHTVTDPAPGRWELHAGVRGHGPDDIGFWLEGIPNIFAPMGGSPRAPDTTSVDVAVRIDPDTYKGPVGDVGTVWGWTTLEEEALAAYRMMGLSAAKNFYPQVDMEGRVRDGVFVAENDDRDPRHIDWDGFVFPRFRYRLDVYDRQAIPMSMLAVISRIAPWATTSAAEIAEYAEACVRYHQLERPTDPSRLYWQFLNEPNHEVGAREYVDAFKAVGVRLAERLEANGVPVRLGGPATGNAWTEPGAVPWEWIEALLREADDALDVVIWNQYRLGRLEDTWRYAQQIEHADSLIVALDSDGQHEEIVIGATNLRGGIILQNERQDGAYSAVWWPSVICHALGTGRCRMLNYFWLIDQGARRKGLLRSDWSMKPVAHATAFAAEYRGDEVLAATSDHDGISVLATRDSTGTSYLLVVNTLERPVTLDVAAGTRAGSLAHVETFDAKTAARLVVVAENAPSGSLRIRLEGLGLAGIRIEHPSGR